MNRWNIGILVLVLFVTPARAAPTDADQERFREALHVGDRFELKAHPQGEKLDATLHVTIEEDGTRVDLEGTFRIGEPALYYHLEIDLKVKTYKATRREIPIDWLKSQLRRDGSDYTAAIVPGTWYAEMRLITEDPPQIDLATTVNYVLWTTYSNGSMTINSAYGTCFGYNGTGQPYPTDTHWYISSCTKSFSSPWAQQVNGGYYNWDWGWDDRSTTASHMTKIQPQNNATFTYWNSYSHGGEDNWLLQADLFVNGVQKY